jgi:uncharacterized protein (DUF1015 family)
MVLISGISSFTVDPKLAERVSISGEEPSTRAEIHSNASFEFSYMRINSPLQFHRISEHEKKEKQGLIYSQTRKDFEHMIQQKVFTKAEERIVYIYRCVAKGHAQTGIVCGIHSKEYEQGRLLPNEETIPDKVEDIISVTKAIGIYSGFPLGFSDFPEEMYKLLHDVMSSSVPFIDVWRDEVQHIVYKTSPSQSNDIVRFVGKIPYLCVADGHHRIEAYSELISQIENSGNIEMVEPDFNFIPIILFPGKELKILKFNRIIKEIPEIDDQTLITKLSQYFLLKEISTLESTPENYDTLVSPSQKGEFTFYLASSNIWLRAKALGRLSDHPMETIDTWYLSHYFFGEVLGIRDVRSSKLIEYVPETNGSLLSEQQRCVERKYRLLVVCVQASIEDIEKVSLLKQHMPPKSTLFYPKPLLGLLSKNLERFEVSK